MKNNHEDKTNAMRLLTQAKINYDVSYYENDGEIDGISVARKLHQDPDQVFKTLVTTNGKHEYFVFCIPVNANLDLKKCAKVANQKSLEMLPVKQLYPLTGYIRGGCSPVGMKKMFPTYIEETAQLFDFIYVSAGKIGAQININPFDLLEFTQAIFVSCCKE